MSKAVDWYGANMTLKAPKGYTEEQLQDLQIFSNGVVCVSRWQLSDDALAEINRTGCIFASIMGDTQPPLFVGSHDEVRMLAADHGNVWKLK